jgi:hypothetical protein
MVFAHERGFSFFKGVCGRGIYDNMKTAVESLPWQGSSVNRRSIATGWSDLCRV